MRRRPDAWARPPHTAGKAAVASSRVGRSALSTRSLALAGDRQRPCSSEQLALLSQQRDDFIVLLLQPRQDRHDELRGGVRRHPLEHMCLPRRRWRGRRRLGHERHEGSTLLDPPRFSGLRLYPDTGLALCRAGVVPVGDSRESKRYGYRSRCRVRRERLRWCGNRAATDLFRMDTSRKERSRSDLQTTVPRACSANAPSGTPEMWARWPARGQAGLRSGSSSGAS